jgi:hypothetical protein
MKEQKPRFVPNIEDRRKIVEMFEAGRSYSEIRTSFGCNNKEFMLWEDLKI